MKKRKTTECTEYLKLKFTYLCDLKGKLKTNLRIYPPREVNEKIIASFFEVHKTLGLGLLESV